MSLETGLLTGCAGAELHNSVNTPRKFTKSHTIRKCLLEILIKTGISVEYQDLEVEYF